MEKTEQLDQQDSSDHIATEETVTGTMGTTPSVSKLYLMKVIIKLIPIIIYLRRDRRQWVKQEGKGIDTKKYIKHAEKTLSTFIALGPSYIKLGQWLSTRTDVLPQPYLEVLAKLQDDVPPSDFSLVQETIENEVGKIDNIFDSFDKNAKSGASLGQVYLARYKGRDVIIKAARPDIEKIVSRDIRVLRSILPLATRFIDPNLKYSVEAMFSQFVETISEEMDYRIEGRNLRTIRKNLRHDPTVLIPELIPELTSRHVLSMEYIPGTKITDIASLEAMGLDREKIVSKVHRIFFKMLLKDSIYHADPHPGNVSVTPDGKIILYDFGMVGRIDDDTRLKLVRLYLGLIEKDPARAVNVLIDLGTLEPSVNRNIVEKALEFSIKSLHGQQVDRMEVKALVELTNKTMTKFPFRLPKNLALYMRMSSILEGIYHHHKVKFQFVKVLADILAEEGLLREAYIEETKDYFRRLVKGVESSITLAPILRSYIETDLRTKETSSKRQWLTSFSIIGSGIFIGSAISIQYNLFMGVAGLAISAGTFIAILFATARRKG
ncbi:MAG TPA: AarF/ABC1/UbiB kinase family protein [Nitrososphaeraceae archaeon]|nr:AarF/ABC1/UbiB kinase family protein [Nitrososphaeraceae archaeon]